MKKSSRRQQLLSLPIDNLSEAEAFEYVDQTVLGKTTRVMTVLNAAKVVSLQGNQEQLTALQESDLILADGMSVVWAAKFLGVPIRERVAGCDFFQKLVARGEERSEYRFFLLGAKQPVVEKCVEELQRRHPNSQIVGWRNGYFSLQEEEEIVQQINSSEATVLFLGFSSPFKEEFVYRNREKLEQIRLIQGVGGSFDIVAGITKRAPLWMQKSGLEWFYRFLQEPRRMWRRYLVTNSLFIWLVLKEKFSRKNAG